MKFNPPPHETLQIGSSESTGNNEKDETEASSSNGNKAGSANNNDEVMIGQQIDQLCLEWNTMTITQLKNECTIRNIAFRRNFKKPTLIGKLKDHEENHK